MRTFSVNERLYKARAFDFNMICDLEDMGISLDKAKDKPLSMVRAYFGLCVGGDKEFAGKQLEEHMKKGGKLDAIMEAMGKEMEDSDFFRSLHKDEEAEAPASKAAETTKE